MKKYKFPMFEEFNSISCKIEAYKEDTNNPDFSLYNLKIYCNGLLVIHDKYISDSMCYLKFLDISKQFTMIQNLLVNGLFEFVKGLSKNPIKGGVLL